MPNNINGFGPSYSAYSNNYGSRQGGGSLYSQGPGYPGSSGFSYGNPGSMGNIFSGLLGQIPGYGYGQSFVGGGHRHSLPSGYGGYPAGGPLIIAGGGGGGKKGRQNLQVIGGYGQGGGGPMFISTGGGGGKKGQSGLTIIGGYGQPAAPQYPQYTGYAGEHSGHQFGYVPSYPAPQPNPGGYNLPIPNPGGYNSGGYIPGGYNPGYPAGEHRHSLPGGYGGYPAGGPLIIQGGGGKGGKKGRQNVQVVGGYGQAGGPMFISTEGGGGKKGQSGLTIIGGYGQPAPVPQNPQYTGWAGEHGGHNFGGGYMPIPVPVPAGGGYYPQPPINNGGGGGGYYPDTPDYGNNDGHRGHRHGGSEGGGRSGGRHGKWW